MIFVKIFYIYRLRKFYYEEGFIFLLEKLGYIGMLSKVFAKVLVALFGVEKFLNSPNAKTF